MGDFAVPLRVRSSASRWDRELCYDLAMLTAIKIKNYRGIKEGSITGFGAVNLFVGPNGSGKSSALEAIFLVANQSPEFMYQGWRDSSVHPLVALRHNEEKFPSTDMLYQKQPGSKIEITYQFSNASFTLRGSSDGIDSHGRGDQVIEAYFRKMRLLDIRVLLDRNLEEQAWDQLLNIRGDRDLLKVMNSIYDLNLESFSYSARTRALKALFIDRDYSLNIDDLGAGMRIAFRMFTAILLSGGGAVLAEEFDGYQHVGSFPKFVESLFSLSKMKGTQLFLATHSNETLRTFSELAVSGSAQVDLKIFQTSLSKDGVFHTAALKPDEAQALMTGGFDIRRTD